MYIVAALYRFSTLEDFEQIQKALQAICDKNAVKGTLLLAKEGINGTIAGSREGIDAVISYIRSDPRLSEMEYKESHAEKMPFHRMKVRLKKEIVTLGVPGVDPNKTVGTYLSPQEWNSIMEDPEVVVIDTRNDYECDMGTFKGAINPNTKAFREFPEFVANNYDPQKHKKVAMFCTGGIRCEKASSFMLEQGFEEVYHLKGGILKYLEEIPQSESLWEGECFVFDERVGIKHGLEVGGYELCRGCRYPISDQDKESEKFQEGISCPRCYDVKSEVQKQRATARHRQMLLAKERGEIHLGTV